MISNYFTFSAVEIQGWHERTRDEKHGFTFHNLPFLALIARSDIYGEKLTMEKHNTRVGLELLSLLRQQRYLYHQLKNLTDRQQQLAGANSPELLLEVTSGRRKLVEKLRELDNKLRPIKANWQKLSGQIQPEHKLQVREMANHVREIIGQISAVAPSQTAQNLPLNDNCRFDELFVEAQSK